LSKSDPSTDLETGLPNPQTLAEQGLALYVAGLNEPVIAALPGVTKMPRI